jgi:hypothetical protein
MAKFSGVLGTVKSGATDMDVQGWSADIEAGVIDSTTTSDGGWESAIGGPLKISGSFVLIYVTTKKPTGATANLTPGSRPTLTLQVTTGETISGTAFISKLSFKMKVKDGAIVTASFQSGGGAWTLPS